MDTRKLLTHITNGGAVYVTDNDRFTDASILMRIDHEEKNADPEVFAAELVKRWNAFPALLKALQHTIQEDAVNIDWQMVAETIKTFGGEPVPA